LNSGENLLKHDYMMMKKKVRFDKTPLYTAAISVGLLTLLVGDSLRSMTVDPVPALTQVIAVNPDDWKSLADAVSARTEHFSGRVGYIIKDFKSGRVAGANADMSFPSASLIKFPILCAAFKAVEEGKLSLSTPVTLQRSDKKGGSGVLKHSPTGSVYTNRELLEYMIGNSDNTAADLLVRQLGYDYLQKTFTQLGLQDTRITPEGFKLTSRRVDEDNMTSPGTWLSCLKKFISVSWSALRLRSKCSTSLSTSTCAIASLAFCRRGGRSPTRRVSCAEPAMTWASSFPLRGIT
jgi:hypothetical protein